MAVQRFRPIVQGRARRHRLQRSAISEDDGDGDGEDLSRLGALEASQEPRTYGADTWLQKGFVGAAAQLPIMADMLMGSVRRGIEGAAYGGTIAALAGAGPQVALPEELITVPIGMATGYSVGSAAGAYERSAQQQGRRSVL